MNNLAIIPARGGSKRVPGKNIREFLGKPIIAYSIELAINSQLFTRILVSTDDEKIAQISRSLGAEVPFLRSRKNSDDQAPLADVIDEVYKRLKETNEEYDYICCILATNPLLTLDNLEKGFHLLKEKNFDSVRPVVPFDYPPEKAFYLKDNVVEFANPDKKPVRTQDLENLYHDAGQFYWMKSEIRLQGVKRGGFIISELEYQDIDDETDWIMAELKYKHLHQLWNQ